MLGRCDIAGRKENLKLIKTTEEARKRGKNGGIASGIARRKQKLLSSVYADFLANKHDIRVDGERKYLSGAEIVGNVMKKILIEADSSAVSMMKEIREATEGNRMTLIAELPIIVIEAST